MYMRSKPAKGLLSNSRTRIYNGVTVPIYTIYRAPSTLAMWATRSMTRWE